jgi:arylsulfatase A-like enzyme
MLQEAMHVCLFAALLFPAAAAVKPHLVFLLQDDLGFDDIGFNNPASKPFSPTITSLAQESIVLNNHYVHWHCSPTRRSFLTGRLPIHHGEMLSGITDDIDLRWNIISQKLGTAGYRCLWFGKGHTGYKSMAHMPTNRGFDHATFFLGGAQKYTSTDRWKDAKPYPNSTYSSYLYGEEALQIVQDHNPKKPLFLYFPMQAVHDPYDVPPDPKPEGTALQQMLWAADLYVGKILDAMKEKGMWENTLVVYSADNGGTTDGTNYPKRGQKHTNFEGGMNVAAFVSGGFLPSAHRGTTADVTLHIVDWYSTFCALAGVDPADDSPKKPLPVDTSLPPVLPPPKDIYGQKSWAGVDGVNVWPILLSSEKRNDPAAAHPELTLSREVLILNGTWKIVVAQPDPSILAMKHDMPPKNNQTTGWRYRNHSWFEPHVFDPSGCGMNFLDRSSFRPCLFNIRSDPREMSDLSKQHPELMQELWGRLNQSFLTWYHSRTPARMLGNCNKRCASKHWKSLGGSGQGPQCGLEACSNETINDAVVI